MLQQDNSTMAAMPVGIDQNFFFKIFIYLQKKINCKYVLF